MSAVSQNVRRVRIEGYPARNLTFETVVGFLSALFVFGLFVDGWAHNHGKVDTSFFTPYHAVMYGSFALLGITLVGMQFYNASKGYAFLKALPYGYFTSLCGVLVFALGGAADMVWHLAFGVEVDLEALISPSHLILIIGYLLILGGLVRAAWARREESSWSTLWQMLIAWAGILSVLLFILQYLYLINSTRSLVGFRPGGDNSENIIGAARFFVSSILFTGVTLMALRRWRLPVGAVTFLYGLSALLMGWMLVNARGPENYWVMLLLSVAPAVFTGFITDVLIWRLKPDQERRSMFYLLGAVIPFVLSLSYIASIHAYGLLYARSGLWWRVHMWLGIPMMAMIIGVLLGLLLMPPRIPQESER